MALASGLEGWECYQKTISSSSVFFVWAKRTRRKLEDG